MKKILLSTLLLISTALYTQELDPAYLASLPEDVRTDVLEKMTDREDRETPVYRRPSTMTGKVYCDDLEEGVDIKCIERSERFGSKIFDMMQSSFMPINEPNQDSSYIIDFGDTLEIQLTGQKESTEELGVKRDGSINIPGIGKIFVSGLSLESVNQLIKKKIKDTYLGIDSFVTLTNVRDIQVLVTGSAFNPGIYTLNGNSNVLHALNMAGGIDEIGSYRSIDLIRNNTVIKTIDLYDIFVHGKVDLTQRLRTGDSILIKSATNLITLSGAVRRPSKFELLPNENFKDLLNYGNGTSLEADLNNIRIERSIKGKVSYIKVSDIAELSRLIPFPGDRLNIRSYERKSVSIIGAINTPGTYAISEGETLSSLIEKAEGYKKNAYPFAGILNNVRTKDINEISAEKLYTSFVQKLITKGDAMFASESLPFVLEELKKTNISGRVMAEFNLEIIELQPDLDTTLEDGDEIIIPTKTQQVYIFGEVNNTGTIRYKPSQSINGYLTQSGGLLESADSKNIFVVHPNGQVNRLNTNIKLSFLNNRSNDILIYPGSIIFVPRQVKTADAAMVASIWAPILSAMATSITALSVLSNN
jgi:protein involved in polysaccharide export with SLBB domain